MAKKHSTVRFSGLIKGILIKAVALRNKIKGKNEKKVSQNAWLQEAVLEKAMKENETYDKIGPNHTVK